MSFAVHVPRTANELCGALEALEPIIGDKVLIKQVVDAPSLKPTTSEEPSIGTVRGATGTPLVLTAAQNIPLRQLVCARNMSDTVDDAAQGLKNMIFAATGCSAKEVIDYLADWDGGSYDSTYESLDTIEVILRKTLKQQDDLQTSLSIDSCDYTVDSELSMSQCASLRDEIEVPANEFKASLETIDTAAESAESKFPSVADAPDIELNCSTVGSVMTEVQTSEQSLVVVQDTSQELKSLDVSQKSGNSGDDDVSVKTETNDEDAEVKSEEVQVPKFSTAKKTTKKNAVITSFFRRVKSKRAISSDSSMPEIKEEAAIGNDGTTSLKEEFNLGDLKQPDESFTGDAVLVPTASNDNNVPAKLEVATSEISPNEPDVVVEKEQLPNELSTKLSASVGGGSVTECNDSSNASNEADENSAEKEAEFSEKRETDIHPIEMKLSESSKVTREMKIPDDSKNSCTSKQSKKSLSRSTEAEAQPSQSNEDVVDVTVPAGDHEIVIEMKVSDDKSCSSKKSTTDTCAAAVGDFELSPLPKKIPGSSCDDDFAPVPFNKAGHCSIESNNPELKSLSSESNESDTEVECPEDLDWGSFISDGIAGIKSTTNAKPNSAPTRIPEEIRKPSKMSMVRSFIGKARTKPHSDKLGRKRVSFSP